MENQVLKKMLQFKPEIPFQLLPARVIAKDPLPGYHLLTINRGSAEGVKKNQLAVTGEGVIGYIFHVYTNTSQILLLIDRNAVLPITIQRSRVHALLEGAGRKSLKLKYLKNEDDVVTEDQVVTSGFENKFPAGLYVGSVSSVQKDEYGLSQEVVVTPSFIPSQIEKLFIILN